jgi:PRC-barrel domain
MLRSVESLEGFSIGATDGTIGKVKDFYFDDEAWVIRYAEVNANAWLGHEVLISPHSLGQADSVREVLPVTITKDQVEHSPGIDTDKPISRQYEASFLGYYGYPYYWGGNGLWGERDYPGTMLMGRGLSAFRGSLRAPSAAPDADPHLHSCNAVMGYHIHARDGEIGHVQGFLVDDYLWSVRYLIVNTSNWWVGHQVVISPEWISGLSWSEAKVTIDLDRQAIKDAPAYDEGALIDRDAELRIYNHYGRNGYWQSQREREIA